MKIMYQESPSSNRQGAAKPVRILVETLADRGLLNAQMGNAREIIARLDPEQFHVTTFHSASPDQRLALRPNTRLVPLPPRRQTVRILREFLFGAHDLLFYVKASPASRVYMILRRFRGRRGLTVSTVESQSNLQHEPTISKATIQLIEQTALRADYFFSNSRFVQRSLQENYGLASEVVPTGVDTKFFSPAEGRPPNVRLRVLFVGSLRPFKGPQLVLEAARRFSSADFIIVGDGIMREELGRDSATLANVKLKGELDAEGLMKEYRCADVFFFPSRWEGSPKVLAEAAACGLPVVARSDYEPETVIHGETGLLGADDAEVLSHLERLLASRDLRQGMGRRARSHIARFDWDLITMQWEKVFLRLTARDVAR
jgi:glycosyltransferase involved in cell wall biosynthesis